MAFRVRNLGELYPAERIRAKQAGVFREIKTVRVMDGGTLRTVARFADDLIVTSSSVDGRGTGTEPQTVTTSTAKATVSGGYAPYSYLWQRIANGGGTGSSAQFPASASTNFSKPSVPVDAVYTDTWRVTVTDSTGATATATISAIFNNVEINTGGN